MKTYNIIIIGAGAAGLFAAAKLCQSHKNICVIDMGDHPARKVAVSGGGKCNFTNTAADYKHYFGNNPEFTRGALARWTHIDTLNWAKAHKIKVHEKSAGQYFAETSADITNALLQDIQGTELLLNTHVLGATKQNDIFTVKTDKGNFQTKNLVIATGGISYANLGTTDIGYKIAKSFGHKIIPPRPALCGIITKIFDPSLSGISIPAEIKIGREILHDDMLFTHFGIGGPAIYRTTVRNCESGFTMNLLPDCDAFQWLKQQKQVNGKRQLKTILATKLPERIAEFFANKNTKNIADYRDTELKDISNKITNIKFTSGTFSLQNFLCAEVTRGGIDTTAVSSKTMESKLCPGLYFIGEVLDVAGDLGGFNLQWAWCSAHALDI